MPSSFFFDFQHQLHNTSTPHPTTKDGSSASATTSKVEDSWFWESDPTTTATTASSSASSASHKDVDNGAIQVAGDLTHIPLDATSSHPTDDELQRIYESERIAKQLRIENAILNEKLVQLGDELRQSATNVEEMDRDHDEAVEKLLTLKGDAQTKCRLMEKELAAFKEQHCAVVEQLTQETRISQSLRADLQSKTEELLGIARDRELAENFELVEEPNTSVKHLEAQLAELQTTVNELHTELIDLKAIRSDLENRLSDFQQAKQEQDLIRIDLEMQLKDQQSEFEDRLQTNQERCDQEVAALEAEVDELNEKLQDDIQLEANAEELTNRLHKAESEIDLKCKELISLRAQFDKLESQNEKWKAELISAQHSAEFEQLKSDASECESKLIHENLVLQKRLDDLHSSLSSSDDPTIKLSELIQLLSQHVLIDPSKTTFDQIINYIGETLASIDRTKTDLDELTDKLEQLTLAKQRCEHEKQTTQADLHHYEVEVAELMKNNEILLLELDALKTGKLETITEQDEENIIQLEQQLEDCSNLNESLEGEYLDMRQRLAETERNLTDQQADFAEQQQRLNELKNQLKNVEQVNTELQNNEYLLNEQNATLRQEIVAQTAKAEEQMSQLKNEIDLITKKLSEKEDLILKKSSDIDEFLEQIRFLNTVKEEQKTDPLSVDIKTLNQQLVDKDTLLIQKSAHIQSLEYKIDQLNQDIILLDQLIVVKSSTIDDITTQLNDKDSLLAAKSSDFLVIQALNQEQQNQINLLTKQITAKKELITMKSAELKTLIQQLQSNEHQSQASIEALTQQLAQTQEIVSKKSADNEDLLKKLRDSKREEDQYSQQIREKEDLMVKHTADSLEQIKSTKASDTIDQDAVITELRNALEATVAEKNQLIVLITAKHQESSAYHEEIQRLNILLQETAYQAPRDCPVCPQTTQQLTSLRDREEKFTDQVTFLREKADILTANLMTEQANQTRMVQQREQLMTEKAELQRALDRLRAHLLEVEESHTQEAMELQRTVDEVTMKMAIMESEAKKSSTAFTSAR